MRTLYSQFCRYVVVGGVSFAFDFSVLSVCVEKMGLPVLTAASAGFIVGALVNYFLCLKFVFFRRSLENFKSMELVIFLCIGLVGLLVNNLVIYSCNSVFKMDYQISKFVAAAIVLLFNFTSRKIVLFTPSQKMSAWIGKSAYLQKKPAQS